MFEGSGLINQSWRDHETGMLLEENKVLHDTAVKLGEGGWGSIGRIVTYTGTGVGLMRGIAKAGCIVTAARHDARMYLDSATQSLNLRD